MGRTDFEVRSADPNQFICCLKNTTFQQLDLLSTIRFCLRLYSYSSRVTRNAHNTKQNRITLSLYIFIYTCACGHTHTHIYIAIYNIYYI